MRTGGTSERLGPARRSLAMSGSTAADRIRERQVCICMDVSKSVEGYLGLSMEDNSSLGRRDVVH
jgi:hypothetical protein